METVGNFGGKFQNLESFELMESITYKVMLLSYIRIV
jgi:hypothetical protein